MRTLRTIGDLGALRAMRDMDRQSRLAPLMGFAPSVRLLGSLGATNPQFAPPAGLNSATMSQGLSDALNTLLQTYSANGVPPESAADATAGAFQAAWNADAIVTAAGGNALLAQDSGYGPNTALAVSTVNGGSFPPVNGGATPAPIPGTTPAITPVPVAPAAPIVPAAGAKPSHAVLWLLAILAAAGAAYAAHRMMKKKHRGRRRAALPSRAIVLT